MVTSRLQAAPAMRANGALRKGASPIRSASPTRHSPHLVLQQPAWAPAEEGRRRRNRESVKVKRELKIRGEMMSMLGVLGVFAAFCACGVVYLAAYAGVAAQSHQITLLQQQLSSAQAQHEVYVQQMTVLASAARIQTLAKQHGMIMSDSAHYLTVTASGQDGAAVTQVASAR